MAENVFVVMPAYNAAGTIERVFERIPGAAKKRITRYVVVDDGSTDDTRAALVRIEKSFLPELMVLTHSANRGYGAAEKTLLRYAVKENADIAVLLHSDGQYSPEKIPDLLEPFDSDTADLVQGSRMLGGGAIRGGMPLYKYISNRILTFVENFSFGMRMAEFHSGYMVYSRRTLLSIPFEKLSESFDFDLEMIVMAHILELRIREIAIPTIYGEEVSYLNPVKYGIDVLKVVQRYRQGYYHGLLDEVKHG